MKTILENTKDYIEYCKKRLKEVEDKHKGYWRREISKHQKYIRKNY